ncbi:PTS sugar transporter subunit IIA [Nocardioides sp. MAHUQ-72]|uniref:PTS sugar transporter subunit IIA n=1 Tax=unclassified Nocardioides TaxID=2615069 RepID=UPI00360A3027
MSQPETPVTTPAIVALGTPVGEDTRAVVSALTELLVADGRVGDADAFVESVMAREALASTALPGGFAIPHARTPAVAQLSVAVARLPRPVALEADGPAVGVVLLIAAPDDDPQGYLAVLSQLAGACVKSSFRSAVRDAESPEELAALVSGALGRR